MIGRSLRKLAEDFTDSQEIANAEVGKNRTDNREYLSGIFSNGNAFGTNMNREVKKLFPGGGDKQGGNPFMKLAQGFYSNPTEPPGYQQAIFLSFSDELEKIANLGIKTSGIPGQTMGQLKQRQGIRDALGKVFRIGAGSGSSRPLPSTPSGGVPGFNVQSAGLSPAVAKMRGVG